MKHKLIAYCRFDLESGLNSPWFWPALALNLAASLYILNQILVP